MSKKRHIKKRISAVIALIMVFCMMLPTAVFAREEWDGVKVGYNHVTPASKNTPKIVTNNDDGTQEWVYCICPTRDASSNKANADFRYRYNLSNSPHYFDNSQNINRRDGAKSDYMLDSGTLDFLAKVLYVAYQDAGNSYTGGGSYSYEEIQNAVYWAVIYGKADPDQAIRGGGKVGSIYRGGNAENIIQAAKNATLPDGYTLWLYVPDSNAGGGNLQNTVNATFGPSTPPKKVQVQFKMTKVLEGDGAPALKDGQFTFTITGPDGYSQQITNKADGTIETPVLEYTANQLWSDGQRTFEYTIEEVEGSDSKIEYDDLKANVNVNVQRGDDGELYVNIWGEPVANSKDNEDNPGMFRHSIATFTNKYNKSSGGPEITNTTVTLNGNVEATSSEAAKYTVPAGGAIDVSLTDKVEYEGLDASKAYTITSTVTNAEGDEVESKDTSISGKTDGTETVAFNNLTAAGDYFIKTELKDDTGAVIYTHNGDLDLKEEMATIEKEDEAAIPSIKNTTARLSGTESTTSKPAEIKLTPEVASVGVKFEDIVELSNLQSGYEYQIVSEVYKDDVLDKTYNNPVPPGETQVVVAFDTFDSTDDTGTYTIKTKLQVNGPAGPEDIPGAVVHNDNLKQNAEKVILTMDEYKPQITNTTAILDGERGNDSSVIEKKVDGDIDSTLKDEVGFKGLEPGKTYSIKSTLYRNGEAQSGDGKVVTTSNVTSATVSPIEVEFANITETGKYTILTELIGENGDVVAKHNGGLKVRSESATITDGQELKTTVKAGNKSASSDSPLMAEAGEVTSFVDTIEYKDLSGGQTYEVTGTLKEVKDGKVVDENVATATDTFKAESNGSGTWELEFKDVKLTPGKTYVVFEKAANVKDAKDKAEHENPDDKAQTIVVSNVSPDLVKTVNGGKATTLKSKDDTVEFSISATVPYGVGTFKIKDTLPDPLLYVEDSIKITIDGTDITLGDNSAYWSIDLEKEIEVALDGAGGNSMIDIADCYGKEIVVTFECSIDPDADLSQYKKITNVAVAEVDGIEYVADDDNKASVLGISDLGDDEDEDSKSKGVDTGDTNDYALWLLLIGFAGASTAGIAVRRRVSK